MSVTIHQGDCVEVLRSMKARGETVQCCVTSPPYFGLRDYGHDGQIGLETTPAEYVTKMVEVFASVRDVLADEGTLWLNLGDSYAAQRGGTTPPAETLAGGVNGHGEDDSRRGRRDGYNPTRNAGAIGLKHKDLIGIPWRVAFALQADGWYLRSAIPWLKRNCMPESVTDRPTSAVEYVFLLSKSESYYYDHDAVKMPVADGSVARLEQDIENQMGTERANGGANTNGNFKAVCSKPPHGSVEARKLRANPDTKSFPDGERNGIRKHTARESGDLSAVSTSAEIATGFARNRRNSDWFWESWQGLVNDEDGDPLAFVVNPQPYKEAHFATWPPRLVQPMIRAGCPVGGTVLDCFGGSGTTGEVAEQEGRHSVLIELNPKYVELAKRRTQQMGLLHSA